MCTRRSTLHDIYPHNSNNKNHVKYRTIISDTRNPIPTVTSNPKVGSVRSDRLGIANA